MEQIDTDIPAGKYWYVIHCNPQKEVQAAQALGIVPGLEVYLPIINQCIRGKVRCEPLFPRYLFVQANLHSTAPSHINAIYGVNRLVMFNNVPQPVPHDIMMVIQQQVARLNEQGGLPRHQFIPGDPVRLKSGPLEGLEAIFLRDSKPDERVRILIKFLGDLREMDVDVDMLESTSTTFAAQDKPQTRERRTRGKGRKIKC